MCAGHWAGLGTSRQSVCSGPACRESGCSLLEAEEETGHCSRGERSTQEGGRPKPWEASRKKWHLNVSLVKTLNLTITNRKSGTGTVIVLSEGLSGQHPGSSEPHCAGVSACGWQDG